MGNIGITFSIVDGWVYIFFLTSTSDPHQWPTRYKVYGTIQMSLSFFWTECCHLISWCLQQNPDNRLKLAEILQHAWFQESPEDQSHGPAARQTNIPVPKMAQLLCVHTASDTQRLSEAMSLISNESRQHERQTEGVFKACLATQQSWDRNVL